MVLREMSVECSAKIAMTTLHSTFATIGLLSKHDLARRHFFLTRAPCEFVNHEMSSGARFARSCEMARISAFGMLPRRPVDRRHLPHRQNVFHQLTQTQQAYCCTAARRSRLLLSWDPWG
jgi:hypothetical protein